MYKQILHHFEDLRLCPICKQELNEPRVIPCGHTFCLACIEPLQHKYNIRYASKTSTLTCPVCSKVCDVPKAGVEQFPHIVMANQVKTAFEEVEHMMQHTQCAVCEKRIRNPLSCKQCVDYFCEDCAKQHTSVFTDHDLLPTAENPVAIKCKTHCNQFQSHYCARCLEVVCPLCATKHHSNKNTHNIMLLEDANEHFINHIGQQIRKFEENLVHFKESLDEIYQRLLDEEHQYVSRKRSIEEAAEACRKKIAEEEESLLFKIWYRHDENNKCLQEARLKTISKCETMDQSITLAKDRLTSLKDHGVLKTHDDRLRTLSISDISLEDDDDRIELELKRYNFLPSSIERHVGRIEQESPNPDTSIDQLKSFQFADELSDQEDIYNESSDQSATRIKEIYTSTPQYVTEHLITSGVEGTALTMIGVGLTEGGYVLCAINAHNIGQVVLSRSSNDQQVIYHRRKGISAFAVSGDDKCGVALMEDNHVNILSLYDLQDDREATCQTFKHSYGKARSSIQAVAFNENDEIIISDRERNIVTCFDSQWRRPFNISGKTKNSNGTFNNAAGITVGSAGEIIIFDNITKNLVVFKRDTKYSKTIGLERMSNACSIAACHSGGVVFVADCKKSCVFKVDIDNDSISEVLTSESGIKSPSCISVKGNILAVSNMDSFSNAVIRLYKIASE